MHLVFYNSYPSTAKFKNELTYTSASPICLHGMCRDNIPVSVTDSYFRLSVQGMLR
jgi:hypothetical protein